MLQIACTSTRFTTARFKPESPQPADRKMRTAGFIIMHTLFG